MSKDNLTAVLYGVQDLRLEQRPIPEISDNEVLLEMDCVGICGSDMHYLVHGRIGDFVVNKPMVIGREAAGVVVKCGKSVKNLVVGDRVAIVPGVPCRFCKTGKYNLCPDMVFCATPPYDGNLTKYYRHAADFFFKLPPYVTMEEGALLEPLSVGVHACRRADVGLGSEVLILGAGPIGLVTLLVAQSMGASNIVITDLFENRLNVAKSLGAMHTVLISKDKTIDCCGAESTTRLAILNTRSGRCVVIVGMGGNESKLSLINASAREVDIRGVFRYCNDYPTALALVASGKVDAKCLVTHHFDIIETAKAFETSRYGQGGAIKVMIHCQPRNNFFDMVSNVKVFKENFHMEPETFRTLFEITEPFLFPLRNTRPHDNITALEKFAVVIEFLASGAIQRHVAGVYRISKQHFGKILDDVCTAICKALSGEIATLDETEMVRIANEFNAQWNLPNCVGAIDGKHVAIKCPPNAGSMFYNYKGFHSIVLMAIADANYKFVYIDVGGYGSEGDANVFGATQLGKDIIQNKLPFPPDMPVGPEKLPFYFVADDAFPLKKRIVKPFVPRKPNKLSDEERIANYRISRARRCVENCFGILVSKWICLSRTMFCGPDKSQKVVSACCYLHNYLLRTTKSYCPQKFADYYDESGNLIEGEWRKQISKDDELSSFQSAVGRPNECGKILRNKLKDFVNSPIGSLPWQKKAAYLE